MTRGMWKYVVLAILVAAVAVAAVVAHASSADERSPDSMPAARSASGDLDRALELVRDCRVRSTLSLHSGAFHLQLEDGTRIDLPSSAERDVYAEIQRAAARCGSVVIAME